MASLQRDYQSWWLRWAVKSSLGIGLVHNLSMQQGHVHLHSLQPCTGHLACPVELQIGHRGQDRHMLHAAGQVTLCSAVIRRTCFLCSSPQDYVYM